MDQKDPQDHRPLADLGVAWVVVEAHALAGLKSLRDREVHLRRSGMWGGFGCPTNKGPISLLCNTSEKVGSLGFQIPSWRGVIGCPFTASSHAWVTLTGMVSVIEYTLGGSNPRTRFRCLR